MSAIVGERDRLLEAAIDFNLTPRQGKDLSLTVDASSFHVAVDGAPTPAFVTFTAHKIDLAGEDNWVASNGATLTGSGLTRTLAYSAMPGANTTVTLTTVEDGQIYTAKAFIGQVKDGLPGTPADPADISAATLLTTLEGQITESQLFADLKSKIDLVTDPVSVAGSVQARIKAETDARIVAIGEESQQRIDAISQEVDDRIAAVLAEANARATYVQDYTYSKLETTQALSIQASQIAAAWTSYTDQKTGQVASTAAADVRNYSYSKATVDSSIAASESRLRAEFVGSGGATEAFVTNYAYSRAYIDGAEASQSSTLTTSLQGYADAKKSEAITAAAADVRNYTFSKSDINAAEAAQSSTLTANFSVRADAARDAAISSASADVRNYSYAKSATDSAIAAAESRLRSEFVGSGGATEAYVSNYAYSKAQIDAAEAMQSSTLTAGYTSAIGGIRIGGRNLYTRATTFSDPTSSGAIFAERLADGFTLVGVSSATGFQRMAVPLSVGPYTLSFNLRLRDGPGILWLDLADTATQTINQTSTADTHYEFHFDVTNAGLSWLDFNKMNAQGYYFTQFKLEAGNKATSYTAAPEDVAADIAGAVVTAAADVRQYAYAKSDTDAAFASQSSQITAAYTTYADAGKAQAIAAAAADIRNYSYSKATVDGAIASSTSSLTTTVGNHTATLQSQSTSLDGLSTQFTLKSDINGYITGYGFASSANNGNPMSAFIINAGAFAVVAPGAAPRTMFTVGLVNGVAQMVLRGDALFDGAVTARSLRIGSFDNIVPDPGFYDRSWWGFDTETVAHWSDAGQNSPWSDGSSTYLGPADGVERSRVSKYFPITAGATYKLEVQVNIPSGFNGRVSVWCLLDGVAFVPFAGDQNKGTFSDGLVIQHDYSSPQGVNTYRNTLAVPVSDAMRGQARVVVRYTVFGGSQLPELGSVRMTRMSDDTLITNEGVTTPKLATNAVTARTMDVDAVRARNIYADSVTTPKIIANGITDVDSFGTVQSIQNGGNVFVLEYASKVLITATIAPYAGPGPSGSDSWGYTIDYFDGGGWLRYIDQITEVSILIPVMVAGTYRVFARTPGAAPVTNMNVLEVMR